jgi:hypothetical protein
MCPAIDWQPPALPLGTDLNTQNRWVCPDLKRNDVPGQQEYPDLKRNTLFDVPGTEGQGRPVLSKLTNFRIPGPEGQRRPELAKLTNFKVPGSDRQERPALSQCTANVPNAVDPSARNDSDIDLEYR